MVHQRWTNNLITNVVNFSTIITNYIYNQLATSIMTHDILWCTDYGAMMLVKRWNMYPSDWKWWQQIHDENTYLLQFKNDMLLCCHRLLLVNKSWQTHGSYHNDKTNTRTHTHTFLSTIRIVVIAAYMIWKHTEWPKWSFNHSDYKMHRNTTEPMTWQQTLCHL